MHTASENMNCDLASLSLTITLYARSSCEMDGSRLQDTDLADVRVFGIILTEISEIQLLNTVPSMLQCAMPGLSGQSCTRR